MNNTKHFNSNNKENYNSNLEKTGTLELNKKTINYT